MNTDHTYDRRVEAAIDIGLKEGLSLFYRDREHSDPTKRIMRACAPHLRVRFTYAGMSAACVQLHPNGKGTLIEILRSLFTNLMIVDHSDEHKDALVELALHDVFQAVVLLKFDCQHISDFLEDTVVEYMQATGIHKSHYLGNSVHIDSLNSSYSTTVIHKR